MPWRSRFDSLDRVFIAAIVCLLAAIGVTITRGDQVGIGVQTFSPTDIASSRPTIRLTFDEQIDPQTVSPHFTIDPSIKGSFAVNGTDITFQPALPLQPGKTYKVTIQPGLGSTTGRLLKQPVDWQFSVRSPRVVYLGSENDGPSNLYIVDPSAPDKSKKITDSQRGIANYDVSQDGSQIVYGELPTEGVAGLFLWDAVSGTSSMLYDCPDAWCRNPVWSPDGSTVAFEYLANTNSVSKVTRVWVLDVASKTAKPLFSDNQELTSSPRWSPDGTHLAVYDTQGLQLIIHDMRNGKDLDVPSPSDDMAHYSPDGTRMALRIVVAPSVGKSALHMILIDPSSAPIKAYQLAPNTDPASDEEAVWLPSSAALIAVRALSGAKGQPPTSQVDQIDAVHGTVTQVLAQSGYQPSNLVVSPVGDSFLLNWTVAGKSSDSSGIWLYTMATKALKQIVPAGDDADWIS